MLKKKYLSIYTIKVETIENNSHPKWTTLTPHRWPHTAGSKMMDRWKQLFLKCFHSKPLTFLRIALLCTHCTHLLISCGKLRGRMQITRPHVFKFPCMVISCFQIYTRNLPISIDPRGSDCIGSSSPSSAPRPAAGRCGAWQAAAHPARREPGAACSISARPCNTLGVCTVIKKVSAQ